MTLILIKVVAFLVAVSILISTHEFGHYWVARRLGFKVLRFSIGFGKPLWMRRGRDGVEYTLGTIPLGGYVRLADEREAPVDGPDRERAFNRRPVWARVLVLVAGAAANFLFAALVYWALFMHGVSSVRAVVGAVRADSLAATAGLKSGDEIVRVGSQSVGSREDAALEMINALTDDGRLELGLDNRGARRDALIVVPAERRRALTEPGAWASGLGFEFLEPPQPAVLGDVAPAGPAAAAGLRKGDRILAVDGQKVGDFAQLQAAILGHASPSILLDVDRAGAHLLLTVVPKLVPNPRDPHGKPIAQIGIRSVPAGDYPPELKRVERFGPIAAVGAAIDKTASMTGLTVKLLWRMITGRVSIKNVSGPIGIADFAGVSALGGVLTYIEFLALISISLGILNLLPVPVLDGGQIVYQLAEGISGRPLPERVQVLGQQLGIVLLILLISLACYNDLAGRFG